MADPITAITSIGSFLSTGTGALTAISATAGLAGGLMSYQESKAAEDQLELQAQREEMNARAEQIAMNEELLATIASNNVASAASGLQSSGSAMEAQAAAARSANVQMNIGRRNSDSLLQSIEDRQQNVRRQGRMQLGQSLLSAGQTVGRDYSTYKKTLGS